MAYALRPDDDLMVDVEVQPGVVIPMPRALAEQAGHTQKPSLFDPNRGALALNRTGIQVPPPISSDRSSETSKPTPPIERGRDANKDPTAAEAVIQGAMRSQGIDPNPDARAAGVVEGKELAPEPKKSSALRGGGEVRDDPDVDPDPAAIAARGQGARSGPRLVKLSNAGDVRASYTRVPGQEVPEDVSNLIRGDNYSEGAQQRAEAAGMSPEDVFLSQSAGTLPEDTHDATTGQIVTEQQKAIQARQANIRQEQAAIAQQERQRVQVDQAIRARQKLISDRDAETAKLTPGSAKEVWASKSTFQQIGAAIAVALGGYLQGLQGRANNPGLQMIQDGIAQEVSDQRAKYEAAMARGEQARGDYADAVALYGTPEAAALDLTNRRLEAAAKLTEAQAANIGTLEYKQAAALQSQAIRQEKAANLLKLNELETGRIVQENFQYQPAQYAQVGGGALKPDERATAVRLPDGSYGYARSADQARKAQEQIKVDARISSAAQRLRHLRSLPGAKTDPALRGQIEGAAADLFLGLKQGANLGTLDKGSLDFRDEWLGDPTAIIDLGGADAKLGEVATAARGRVVDTVRYDLQADPKSLDPILNTAPASATPEQ